jgi:VWFA-related protein
MFSRKSLLLVLVLSLPALNAWGQGNRESIADEPEFLTRQNFRYAENEEKVKFRSESVLVQVPVVVTDKSGSPLHKLTKDDFQLFENGKAQKITVFEEVVTSNARIPAPAPGSGVFQNVAIDAEHPRAVTVIALDTVNAPLLDQSYGRRQLIRYLADNLSSGQVLALVVISSRGLMVLHGLTGDPDQLIQALKKVSGELHAMQGTSTEAQTAALTGTVPKFDPIATLNGQGDLATTIRNFALHGDAPIAGFKQDRAIETTLQAFLGISWSLSGIPGKKSLIWATGGFPFTLDSPDTVPGGYLSALYERAMQALNDSNISIYPIDVRGLVNYLPDANATSAGTGYDPRQGEIAMQSVADRSWLHGSTTDSLKEFAAMTGGRAYFNTNDLSGSFKRAADDSSTYYLLGYYLDTHNNKPGWRNLKVKVQKPDADVRTRGGFFVTNTTMDPDLSHKSDMSYAVVSPFDSTGIPVTVKWGDVSPNGEKKKVGFALRMPGDSVTFVPTPASADTSSVNLEFVVVATKDGVNVGGVQQTLQGALKSELVQMLKTQGVPYKNALDLAPGQYQVRFVVRDNLSGRIGSVSAPLTVN